MKHGHLAHVRSQFSLFRRSPTHKNLPPATFCTSERAKKCSPQAILQRTSRFCKPQFSSPQWRLPTNKIKSFCRSAPSCGGKAAFINFPVSLKHGRLAHVRSQFSLFRRSPTHKNLPPATFCTSERKVRPCRDGTLRVLFSPPMAAILVAAATIPAASRLLPAA